MVTQYFPNIKFFIFPKPHKIEMSSNYMNDPTRKSENITTLANERKNATFNVKEMTYVLDGGKDVTEVSQRCLMYLFLL